MRDRYLTAEEARRIANDYIEQEDKNLKQILTLVKNASAVGVKSVNIDTNLLDEHTREKLISLGYRFGKTNQAPGGQGGMQELLYGEISDEDDKD